MARSAYAPKNEASNPTLRPSMGFAQRVDMFTANQLHRLEKQIGRRLKEVANLESKFLQLDEDITRFVEDYYAQVGELCAQIETYETALAQMQPASSLSYFERLALHKPAAHRANKEDTKMRKTLYRRLVKQAHPDMESQTDTAASAAFMQIQSAYESGHITALWQVEWEQLQKEWRICELGERMHKLTQWFRQLEQYAQELTARYIERKQSPEAVLLSHYMQARLSGKDWFGQLKHRLQHHAEQTKHDMVCAKILAHKEKA